MAMAAFSRTSFIAAAGIPFRFSVIRSVVSSGHSSLIAHRTMSVNSTPKPPSSPWLMLPPTFEGGDINNNNIKNMVYQFYSLADDKVVSINKKKPSGGEEEEEEIPDDKSAIVGSSHGWIALFNRKNLDLFLSNPISGRHIKLPPIHNLPGIPQVNLDSGCGCVDNVIISNSDPENDEDCRAVLTYWGEQAFCCPSRRSPDWTLLRSSSRYDSLAYSSQRQLFLCAADSHIDAWDLRDPLSPSMTPLSMAKKIPRKVFSRSKKERELKRLCGSSYKSLVVKEGSDELFYVKQYVLERVGPDGSYIDEVWYGPGVGYDDYSVPYKTVGFDVHKYDPETGSFVYMDRNLGGLALFVGSDDGGFALSPDEFPELKPNSVYYTDTSALPEYCDQRYSGYDIGIFDYEKENFSSCYYPCGLKSMFAKIEPIPRWFIPSG